MSGLLVIFPTFEAIDTVKKVFPSVLKEVEKTKSHLIVHDTSIKQKTEKSKYFHDLKKSNNFFLIESDNLSMARSRNLCLRLGVDLFNPEYIMMLEDDHGLEKGAIRMLTKLMDRYYDKKMPNNLKAGLFSCCHKHNDFNKKITVDKDAFVPSINSSIRGIGGTNSCFRCAPTLHWLNILKGYDNDEYLISTFQTNNLNLRNYHSGYTVLYTKKYLHLMMIELVFGYTYNKEKIFGRYEKKRWDDKYTASDKRSKFIKD